MSKLQRRKHTIIIEILRCQTLKVSITRIILIFTINNFQTVDIYILSHHGYLETDRRCDGGALESSKDEEKTGSKGDRELRHKPDN